MVSVYGSVQKVGSEENGVGVGDCFRKTSGQ